MRVWVCVGSCVRQGEVIVPGTTLVKLKVTGVMTPLAVAVTGYVPVMPLAVTRTEASPPPPMVAVYTV